MEVSDFILFFEFLQIIHCNMGPLTSVNFVAAALVGTYGSSVDAGHADFYRMFLYNDFLG